MAKPNKQKEALEEIMRVCVDHALFAGEDLSQKELKELDGDEHFVNYIYQQAKDALK